MTTPALIPAAMIALVAFAAAVDRRHPAMAAWYGVALAFSPMVLLAAPVFAGIAVARRLSARLGFACALPAIGTALALRALGLPHEGVAPLTWRGIADAATTLPALALGAALVIAAALTLIVRRERDRFA
jgi:hypothetical protein